MNYISQNMRKNYYFSDDFSNEFYVKAAYEGFISISYPDTDKKLLILPEMQFDYALLHFSNLHISNKVQKLLKKDNYKFSINERYEEVIDKIEEYHEDSWITGKYKETLLNLKEYKDKKIDFKIFTSELIDKETNELIAAEVGYKIGKTYTSLSGFFKKEKKYNNYGKLQIVLLAKYLEENGYKFLNFGHPYMTYKFDLGALIYERWEFLKLWREARDL